ncbi:MAG: hypothetical protein NT052_02545 [Candidatus Shapirobacteria bacterium]|nr:hypothetical protein [Candidatus Shapirobacteria bacterium]
MKNKLSKQSIFTILGILVIVVSIPLAVLLVQQRQDIRKEAASWNGTRCAQTDQAECTDWGNPATSYCATKCGGGTTTTTTTTSTSGVECNTLLGTVLTVEVVLMGNMAQLAETTAQEEQLEQLLGVPVNPNVVAE